MKYLFERAWYWFVSHVVPWRRFHVLDLRCEAYNYGWCDNDFRMLYACFACLRSFVEDEHGLDDLWFQAAENPTRVDTYNEVFALWHWWTVERPARVELVGPVEGPGYDQDTEMLVRLIKVRSALWT